MSEIPILTLAVSAFAEALRDRSAPHRKLRPPIILVQKITLKGLALTS